METMTIKETAKRLSVSISKFYSLRRDDASFPQPVQRGKSRRFIKADIDAWEEARFGDVRRQNAERLKNLQKASA
jgi:excisionase family DNA binding protein